MNSLQNLRNFDLENASVVLWAFKGPKGPSIEAPQYSGRWVQTTPEVDAALKATVKSERERIEEVLQYSLLAENHETSALAITTLETNADLIVAAAAAEIPERKVIDEKHLINTSFYVIKLISDDQIIYGVKKTDSSWLTKNRGGLRSFYFSGNKLDIDDRPHFQISKYVDFFVVEENILCLNKKWFESLVRYKKAHIEDFDELRENDTFKNTFSDMQPLVEFIGQNKIQLRRASAIKQKGHFLDANFMNRLREKQAQYGFNIQFDEEGKIIATPDTASQIITALLDHRLASGFSELIYDVQSTTKIQI